MAVCGASWHGSARVYEHHVIVFLDTAPCHWPNPVSSDTSFDVQKGACSTCRNNRSLLLFSRDTVTDGAAEHPAAEAQFLE